MNLLKVSGVAFLLLSLGACATATRGTTTDFKVVTTPDGASVKTSNGFSCDATPCSFNMSRKSEFDVHIAKEGYKDFKTNVVSKMSAGGGAGLAGNVLVGGVIGMGVDAASGALNDLKPNPLVVKLAPVDSTDESVIVEETKVK